MTDIASVTQYVREHTVSVSIAAVIVVITVLFAVAIRYGKTAERKAVPSYEPPTKKDHVDGDLAAAKGVLVIYSDFECPACAGYQSTLAEMKDTFGSDIALVYRNFPLLSIHPNAIEAAVAAEAAGEQGKFFEMGQQLFLSQNEWAKQPNARDMFISYAKNLGLDEKKFTDDLDSDSLKEKVVADEARADKLGIHETPTFFLNGEYIPSQRTYGEFRTLVAEKLYGGK